MWRGSSSGCGRIWAGKPLPYLWVPEWHPGGHGLHLHFAVGRYIKAVADPGRPGVAGSCISSCSGISRSGRGRSRRRGWRPAISGSTRARRSTETGLQVCTATRSRRASSRSRCTAGPCGRGRARAGVGADGWAPSRVWHSSRAEGWQGPPACWAAWDVWLVTGRSGLGGGVVRGAGAAGPGHGRRSWGGWRLAGGGAPACGGRPQARLLAQAFQTGVKRVGSNLL